MTLKELSKLRYLKTLIMLTSSRIKSLEEKLDVGAQVFSDMPKKPGTSDPIGDTVPEIVDKKNSLIQQKIQYEEEKRRIESYIYSVEDYQVRAILILRFIERMKWSEIADVISGGNTEDSVKKACYRYLEKNSTNLSQMS